MAAVSIALAVAAAGCNALSSVLQRRANRDESLPFGRRMLVDLLHRPAWLGGFAALVFSFVLQAVALRLGALATVEPIIALELPLTLLLAGWILRQRPAGRDTAVAVVMAIGLAVFLVAISPSGGSAAGARVGPTALAAILTGVGIVVLVLSGRLGPGRYAAVFYGAAAGSGFGFAAALMKLTVDDFHIGDLPALLRHWSLYGMIAVGTGSVVLVQAALRAGTLVAAQPGLTLLDPLVSVVWGVAILGEQTNTGAVLVVAAAGAAAVVGAAVALSRSPALQASR